MAWVMLDDNFPNHPKVLQAGPVAAWLWVCGTAYCRRYHTGGFIPATAVKTLGVTTNPRRMIDALLEARLWERSGDGFMVHDYAAMYPDDAGDKAKKEDIRIKRAIAGRKGGMASWTGRNGGAGAEANLEAKPKQVCSTLAEPLRGGEVVVPLVASVFEGEIQKGDRREPPPLDVWLAELQQNYPKNRVSFGFLTGSAFHGVFEADARPAEDVWTELRANLAINVRSHEWRVKGMAPKLEKYLREGLWRQQHAASPPVAEQLTAKTSRTLDAAAQIMRESV